MISTQAKDSIERIFYKAAQSRLPREAGDSCEIVTIPQDALDAAPEARVVVLTISSILFRLLLILQFKDDAGTRDYFVKDVAENSFQEIFSEIANLCCGAMNQELLNYFPDLGMSTPYLLSARCVSHLQQLNPGFLASYKLTLNHAAQVTATVCVCAHAPIDFVADLSAVEESSGELELF